MLGNIVLTHDSSEEEIQRFIKSDNRIKYYEEKIRNALSNGETIYYEDLDLEIILPDDKTEIYEKLWEIIKDNDNFDPIKTDLYY